MFQVSSSLASLIEEVVAIFTNSERSVIGKKLSTYLLSFSTFTYFFLLDFFPPLSSAVCFFYVSFYAPPLSVKLNGLLCWYDISGLCVSMMLLSIHIMLLCPLSFPVHSAFGLGFFPPIGLPHSCWISGLSIYNTILTVHALYNFLVLSLALAFSYLLRHTLYLMWYCISDMYDRVRVSIFHAHSCFALQMRLWGENYLPKHVFFIFGHTWSICAPAFVFCIHISQLAHIIVCAPV